jgi:hypothetical protein
VVVGGPGTHPDGRVPDPPGWVRVQAALFASCVRE